MLEKNTKHICKNIALDPFVGAGGSEKIERKSMIEAGAAGFAQRKERKKMKQKLPKFIPKDILKNTKIILTDNPEGITKKECRMLPQKTEYRGHTIEFGIRRYKGHYCLFVFNQEGWLNCTNIAPETINLDTFDLNDEISKRMEDAYITAIAEIDACENNRWNEHEYSPLYKKK